MRGPRRLFGAFTSLKTTIALLCAVGLLLLLNILIPQASVVGEDAYNRLVLASRWNRFLLETLELGRVPTSRIFLGVLALFFTHLACVLAARAGPAWRRTRARPGSEAGVTAWARMDESLSAALPAGWDAGRAARTLQGYGYRVRRIGERTSWGVKHPTAPLGFLLFHLSFFLLCGAALLIYYTRFAGSAVLAEGLVFEGDYKQVLRAPPAGAVPELRFRLEEVDPRFEHGQPVHLGARLQFLQAGTGTTRQARVNHPARWGDAIVLVQQAGLAPVLWLQDDRGYTLDRVVVSALTRGDTPTEVPLAEGRYRAELKPIVPPGEFPSRAELPQTRVRVRLWRGVEAAEADGAPEDADPLLDASLRPGEAASLEGGRLVLEELRYWLGFSVVSERGGGLLIGGFAAGILGLLWRLVLFRREVAVSWDETSFYVVGRSETFSSRFREELESIYGTLRGAGSAAGRAGGRGARPAHEAR